VCDKEAAERCPVFPGVTKTIQWSFKDPSKLEGTKDENFKKISVIRDEIKSKVLQFVNQ